MKWVLLILFVPCLVAAKLEQAAAWPLFSDNNQATTSFGLCGSVQARVGDQLRFSRFSLRAFIEARNEQRFNQSLLPNHNWRGFVATSLYLPAISFKKHTIVLPQIGIEHESAHPTMGIKEKPGSK